MAFTSDKKKFEDNLKMGLLEKLTLPIGELTLPTEELTLPTGELNRNLQHKDGLAAFFLTILADKTHGKKFTQFVREKKTEEGFKFFKLYQEILILMSTSKPSVTNVYDVSENNLKEIKDRWEKIINDFIKKDSKNEINISAPMHRLIDPYIEVNQANGELTIKENSINNDSLLNFQSMLKTIADHLAETYASSTWPDYRKSFNEELQDPNKNKEFQNPKTVLDSIKHSLKSVKNELKSTGKILNQLHVDVKEHLKTLRSGSNIAKKTSTKEKMSKEERKAVALPRHDEVEKKEIHEEKVMRSPSHK